MDFDLPAMVRRIRRTADVSQRDLAAHLGLSKSAVGRIERGLAGLDARLLARAADVAGFRLVVLGQDGESIAGMADEAVRDSAGRRFPAHLDTRYGDEDWWHGDERYSRPQPWFTFDRRRDTRDHWRARLGTPEDHRTPQPGDAPDERRAARRREARRRLEDERARRRATGGFAGPTDSFACTCPARCDELDDWSGKPVHAEDCACACDID